MKPFSMAALGLFSCLMGGCGSSRETEEQRSALYTQARGMMATNMPEVQQAGLSLCYDLARGDTAERRAAADVMLHSDATPEMKIQALRVACGIQ